MLPAPKNKVPLAPERVLGGGNGPGLVFKTAPRSQARTATVEAADDDDDEEYNDSAADTLPSTSTSILEQKPAAAIPFMPPSLVKGKANVSTEEQFVLPKGYKSTASSKPAVDFFSLGRFPCDRLMLVLKIV